MPVSEGLTTADERVRRSGRSCKECRRRKIKCEKRHPCAYCIKVCVICVFDERPRPIRSSLSTTANPVLERLGRIEHSLLQLEDSRNNNRPVVQLASPPQRTPEPQLGPRPDRPYESGLLHHLNDNNDAVPEGFDISSATSAPHAPRKVSPEDFRCEEPTSSFIFSPDTNSRVPSLHEVHPPRERIYFLWQVFIENVDPVLKVLHVPSTQRKILTAGHDLISIEPAFECLLFSIYYASVTSLQCHERCLRDLKEPRDILLSRYRLGVEQALAKADFLQSKDLTILQCLVLYLTCARRDQKAPDVWTLLSVAIRLATRMNLHHDPASLGIPPFESELRRRIWWQLMTLDARLAEDNGTEPSIYEHLYDTRLPLKVNDVELHEEMTIPATQNPGRTEMLFTLLRCEISYGLRQIMFSTKFMRDNQYAVLSTIEQKSDFLELLAHKVRTLYLQDCDIQIPICFLSDTLVRMITAKLHLIIQRPAWLNMLTNQTVTQLFLTTSINLLEYAHSLKTTTECQCWVWMFTRYLEWDAAAILMCSLITQPNTEHALHHRAVVDVFFKDWEPFQIDAEREHQWKNLLKLRQRILLTDHDTSGSSRFNNVPQIPTQSPAAAQGTGDTANWSYDEFASVAQGAASIDLNLGQSGIHAWL